MYTKQELINIKQLVLSSQMFFFSQ